jgi:hypothetical protein
VTWGVETDPQFVLLLPIGWQSYHRRQTWRETRIAEICCAAETAVDPATPDGNTRQVGPFAVPLPPWNNCAPHRENRVSDRRLPVPWDHEAAFAHDLRLRAHGHSLFSSRRSPESDDSPPRLFFHVGWNPRIADFPSRLHLRPPSKDDHNNDSRESPKLYSPRSSRRKAGCRATSRAHAHSTTQ